MKFQPKRFVVEVKRGTSRSAFSSPDAGLDKFSSAEAMLFGASQAPVTTSVQSKAKAAVEAPRRILESLVEPPPLPPVIEDLIERPRRGRKPGSKNKPKPVAAGAPPKVASPSLSVEALAFMTASPAAGTGPGRRDHDPAPEPLAAAAMAGEAREASVAEAGRSRRLRLRDRSSILKRYVLGTEPKPGQSGSLRARRRARAAL